MKNLQSIHPSKFLISKNLGRKVLNLQPNRGFSLIEMIVVIGIFAMLSGLVFSNYSDFNVSASLDNLAHRVALLVREAQVYGISVTQSVPQEFKGFGVYFSTDSAANRTFILFSDRLKNEFGDLGPGSDKRFNSSWNSSCDGTDECYEKISIQTEDYIDRIVALEKTDPENRVNLREVHIVFTRPNPDANIYGVTDGGSIDKLADVSIYIKSPKGAEKSVVVWSTGQISVE